MDLNKHMAERAAEQAVKEQQAMAAAQLAAERWDRAMRRAFKGIMPRKTAHRFLMEAAKREAKERS